MECFELDCESYNTSMYLKIFFFIDSNIENKENNQHFLTDYDFHFNRGSNMKK